MRMPTVTLALLVVVLCWPTGATAQVTLVTAQPLSDPSNHGLSILKQALEANGINVDHAEKVSGADGDYLVLAGLSSGPAGAALRALNVELPKEAEGLAVHRAEIAGKPTVVLCGTDGRGLMYAALDVAERVSWSGDARDPFRFVRDTVERPWIKERAVSIYTMQRAWFERRLYDERHWEKYFDMLAASRINSFVVIFGYENGGFMAPPYPYFFDVEGFDDVELVGITFGQQQRNTAAFRRMIEIAHSRGVEFGAAIWDHIYRGGVQGGGIAGASELAGQKVPGLVHGVTAENLAPYTKAALRKFLDVFADIDSLQFRMHGESGLKREEMQEFWHEVFKLIKAHNPGIRVDLRAKELPDAIIEDALDQGLNARVSTKYWMEQMGPPFHPTHINTQNQDDRRHGYADLLRYPQRYKIHWRLWNGGTARMLLWGDPEYVRRFGGSARLYDGDSFEVNEMLATKMLGEAHDTAPHALLNPEYEYFDYEFERYWHFYQVWGRVGYDPEAPEELWRWEFRRRFGERAGDELMAGLHLASQVLPRIVASSYRYRLFPTTRGWAEMMRGGDLPWYAEEEGSDIQQFLNVADEAASVLEGTDTPMRRPGDSSRWFEHVARRILKHVAAAEGDTRARRGNEFISTVTDLRILAGLARYHSRRLPAGVSYNLYQQTGDLFALDDAIRFEKEATQAWASIVAAAGDVYTDKLAFGVHRVGFPQHWREELAHLRKGIAALEEERVRAKVADLSHVPVRRIAPDEPLRIRATAADGVTLMISETGGSYHDVLMKQVGEGMYAAEVTHDPASRGLRYYIQTGSNKTKPVDVTVTADRDPPTAQLERVQTGKSGENLKVTALVDDPSGVKTVRLRYRHLTQFEDYETAEMTLNPATGAYEASIPGSFLTPKWDVMYFVEVIDGVGNGRMYPDLEMEMPYVVVTLAR